jgi:hypothetical protein
VNRVDPFYLILRKIILKQFFQSDLNEAEKNFVLENIDKHRKALWITLIASTGVYLGLLQSNKEDIPNIILALIAPVTVMGAAWFGISFGSIPEKLITASMSVTFWMFSAFATSLASMIIAVAFISPVLIWPSLIIIFVGALISCIQYDTADGLKAGLDEALLKHSRAALLYYLKQGIIPEDHHHKKTKE